MALTVTHLFEVAEHRPQVAAWIHDAFWRDRPETGRTVADLEDALSEACDQDAIPLSLLAMVGGQPAGTVNLVEDDDSKRPHLRPWLAALYVAPEFRQIGIASALIAALCDHARRLGVAELYLGTDIPDFYRQFGAEVVEREGGHFVMRLSVSTDCHQAADTA